MYHVESTTKQSNIDSCGPPMLICSHWEGTEDTVGYSNLYNRC